ncbi:hypothetical protein ABPG77_005275 [Micractinium sp. CCAP 211/92]
MGLEQSADPAMLPLHSYGHHQRPWYARRKVQGGVVAGLACCCLIVFVLAGPGPKVNSDITSDTPVDAHAKGAGAANAAAAAGRASSAAGGKVQVDFYGESLCPDCQHMVRDVLAPMFSNGQAALMDIKYIAFGNVRNKSDGSYAYQHGDAEGKYNRYILCAQDQHPKQEEWFPYVLCLAENMRALDSEADGCATKQKWEAAKISSCAEGDRGKEIEKEAAAVTWALNPPKNFVPWMVINGVPIGNAYDQLERYVCAASTAKDKPEACYTLPEKMKWQG